MIYHIRLSAQFHAHKQEPDECIANVHQVRKIQTDIAKLQMYQQVGIMSLADTEQYEVDKVWRSHHEIAHLQMMTEMEKAEKKLERKSKEGSSCVSGIVGSS